MKASINEKSVVKEIALCFNFNSLGHVTSSL